MSANLELKKQVVEEIAEKIKNAKSVVFVDYKGLTVAEVSDLRNKFRAAGVNQTVHSIYMDVTATVSIVMPSQTREVSSETEVLVCESVIVGTVPDIYWQGDSYVCEFTY